MALLVVVLYAALRARPGRSVPPFEPPPTTTTTTPNGPVRPPVITVVARSPEPTRPLATAWTATTRRHR